VRNEEQAKLVGLGGFEPPTSPLSGVRSNQLSYRPNFRGPSADRQVGDLTPLYTGHGVLTI
jgi:hypothetical protein